MSLIDILDRIHKACVDAVMVLLGGFGGRGRHFDVLNKSRLEGNELVGITWTLGCSSGSTNRGSLGRENGEGGGLLML